ncbi:contactin-1-like [Amphiura filiformis]|uniref:contactin-1-like n=1 Tax=Amphiura filiformis TaxID=82378 RepID=UPI003B213F65
MVRASNNVGDGAWSQQKTDSIRTIAPGQLTDFAVASVSSSEIRMTWQPTSYSNDCRDTGYSVQYTLVNRDQCQVVEDSPKDASYSDSGTSLSSTLSGLLPYSTYSISVTAVNDAGPGESVTQVITTGPSPPTYIPLVTSSAGVETNSLTFTWDAVPCGQIRGDGLHYQYRLGKDNTPIVDSMSTTSYSIAFENLTACSEYWFMVRASNNVGDGSWSQQKTDSIDEVTYDVTCLHSDRPLLFQSRQNNTEVSMTDQINLFKTQLSKTLDVLSPGQLTDFAVASVLSSEIRMTWQPTSYNNDCRDTGYNVQYTLLNRDQCQVVEDSPKDASYSDSGTSLSSTLSGLLPYSTYSISVAAVNDAGPGESVTQVITTGASRKPN